MINNYDYVIDRISSQKIIVEGSNFFTSSMHLI